MATPPICGVYTLTNTITGNAYVGSSKHVMGRKASHFWQMRANRHKNPLIQSDFDQYGSDSFDFTVIEEAPYSVIRQIEQTHIDSGEYAYNLAPKASGGGAQNEHTIDRMKAAHTGKTHTAATIDKLRNLPKETNGGFVGYYHTPSGTYPSAYEAADGMGGVLNFSTIKRWCYNPDKPFTIHSWKRCEYLKSLGRDIIGITPRQIGFSFTPKA